MQTRIMGLDVGEKTIGVAVSDPLGITAQGVEVIARKNLKLDLSRLCTLINEHNVGHIVVGLPKSLNNTLGPQAEKVQQFVHKLQNVITIPCEYMDERYSTTIAQKSLLEADVSRRKRKEVVDKIAAQIILQGYLDRMGRTQKQRPN